MRILLLFFVKPASFVLAAADKNNSSSIQSSKLWPRRLLYKTLCLLSLPYDYKLSEHFQLCKRLNSVPYFEASFVQWKGKRS